LSAVDWNKLVKAYKRYWALPFVAGFGGVAIRSDGSLPARIQKLRAHQREEAISRVKRTLDAFKKLGVLPANPSGLTQAAMYSILRAVRNGRCEGVKVRELQTFWEAVVLTRANFRCAYCGRSAFEIHEERGQRSALRMVVDHRDPVRTGGKSYIFTNSVAACWSCNHLKGEMPSFFFKQELLSLARAVVRRGPVTTKVRSPS
jgi:HNH endonuclease